MNEHNMNTEIWQKFCSFRRLKIETEFIIDTYEKDAAEKANLLNNLMRNKEFKNILLEMTINRFKNQEMSYRYDSEVNYINFK